MPIFKLFEGSTTINISGQRSLVCCSILSKGHSEERKGKKKRFESDKNLFLAIKVVVYVIFVLEILVPQKIQSKYFDLWMLLVKTRLFWMWKKECTICINISSSNLA